MSQVPHITLLDASELKVRFNDNEVLQVRVVDDPRWRSLGHGRAQRLRQVDLPENSRRLDCRLMTAEVTRRSGLVDRLSAAGQSTLPDGVSVIEVIRDGTIALVQKLLDEYESLPADSNRQTELEQQIAACRCVEHRDVASETAMMHLNTPAPDRLMGTLSGGEKRRVELCRAIVSNPGFADSGRADQPSRHRLDRVDGGVPEKVSRRFSRRNARPVFPR